MQTHRDMPASWSANARARSNELANATARAREARTAVQGVPSPAGAAGAADAPGIVDEVTRRRIARIAAEEARRALISGPPPGPRTA